jgi:hypothetical protein
MNDTLNAYSRQQLPFEESLVKRYAEFEASRQGETPGSKWLFTELNRITGGKITKGHPNGTLMDSCEPVSQNVADQKRRRSIMNSYQTR